MGGLWGWNMLVGAGNGKGWEKDEEERMVKY